VAQTFIDVNGLSIDPPTSPSDLPRYLSQVSTVKDRASAKGVTIAPSAPAVDLRAQDFLETIIGYKEQAIQQGWIKNQGIGVSLDAKLNAAQAALARGNNKTAVNILNALLNEVDAQAGKQLSPEAVALLKFNMQYLISKLP
jgi:FIMAH domain-containing protein